MNQIILSICIPTFNRSNTLDHLLARVEKIKEFIGKEVEICISNNNSSDNTSKVIEKWQTLYPIVVNHNDVNIGFSGNMKKLLEMSNGRWSCFLGDDDLLVPENICDLLKILTQISSSAWVLMPVINRLNPKSSWLAKMSKGRFSWLKMRGQVLIDGISHFGFIGSHIIGEKFKKLYLDIPYEYCEAWIHQNYWFLHLSLKGEFYFTGLPIVEINTSAVPVEYSRSTWAFLWIQRLNNFSNIVNSMKDGKILLAQIFLREFFALSQYKEWARFIIFYPKTSALRIEKIFLKIQPNHKVDSLPIFIYLKLISLCSRLYGNLFYLRKFFIR
jgi:glycosyltransferase involved in cell wall biosynthesis